MKILYRYVLKEYLVPLCYCLGGFLSIYVLFELFGSFSRLAEAKLPFLTAVEYFAAYLSPFFEYLAPAALMLAALYTMWGFCRHSELIAMRANGIGFVTIVAPILSTAVAMAGFVFWVNDFYVPAKAQWGRNMKTEKFVLERVQKSDSLVYRDNATCRTWTVNGMEDSAAEHLLDVKVVVDRPDGGARKLNVSAPRADYLDGEWWFTDPKVQHFDVRGSEIPTPTPELDALRLRCFPEFAETPSDFMMQNRQWEYNSIADRIRFLKTHPNLSEETLRGYRYDVWAKILSPLACIVIVLFAIPAGIASGRQSVFKGILGALGMFFGFYALDIGGMVAAKAGWCPAAPAALLPYVVFLILGVRAFYKQR